MITLEKKNKINKVVNDFLHIVKYGSGIIHLETDIELKMRRIFKKQSDLFWKLESKNNWLDVIYIKAQKDLEKVEKLRMSENPEERINFIANLTEEWHEDINDDVVLNKTLKKSYISDYNFAGQEVLNEFAIKESFKLRALPVLEALEKRAKVIAVGINQTSWDLVNNKIADSFWKEGKNTDKVAKDIRHLFDETYKGRAKNIARTETGEIVSEAQFQSYKKMEVPELEWLTEPNACELCLPLAGQRRKTGEYFDNRKGWRGLRPLVHNNCKCDITPITPKKFLPKKYWAGD